MCLSNKTAIAQSCLPIPIRLSGAEFKSVVESIAQLQGRINDVAHNLDGRAAQVDCIGGALG